MKVIKGVNIPTIDLEKVARNVEALIINPPWDHNKFSFKDLEKLKISRNVVKDGLVFIWT